MKDLAKLRFKFISPFVNEDFFTVVKNGMADAIKLFDVEAEFTGVEGDDTAAMSEMIVGAVRDKYDGLVVSVLDPAVLNAPIQFAMEKGVPVIAFNIGAAPDTGVLCSVCQDSKVAGKKVGKLASKNIVPGSTVLLTLHDDIDVLRQRFDGIVEGLPDVKVIEYVTGNSVDKATEGIRKILAENPDISAIIGTGQADTVGAGNAVSELKGQRNIYIAGFDVANETLEYIKEGLIDFTIDQQPYVQGFYPVMQLYQYVSYGLCPSEIDAGAAVINKENVNDVMKHIENGFR